MLSNFDNLLLWLWLLIVIKNFQNQILILIWKNQKKGGIEICLIFSFLTWKPRRNLHFRFSHTGFNFRVLPLPKYLNLIFISLFISIFWSRMQQSRSCKRHYFSVESILASEEQIPCTFLRDQDHIGKFENAWQILIYPIVRYFLPFPILDRTSDILMGIIICLETELSWALYWV